MKRAKVLLTSLLMLALFHGFAAAAARPAAPGLTDIVIYVGAG